METTTVVRERPMLFSTPMVVSLQADEKSQTRRVIKPQHLKLDADSTLDSFYKVNPVWQQMGIGCPYGEKGDILWVRETWSTVHRNKWGMIDGPQEEYIYKADGNCTPLIDPWDKIKWKPNLFMPREACRIRLEITEVRAERLWDISENDAVAEGIGHAFAPADGVMWQNYLANEYWPGLTPQQSYKTLWEKINGHLSWATNPWVWAISFKRI